MKLGTKVARAALAGVALAAVLIGTGASGAAGAGSNPTAGYWTAARRDAAIPRDLVIDERGLGYLRRPDGSLQPHGHKVQPQANQLSAEPAPAAKPAPTAGPGGSDTTAPVVGTRDPGPGGTIGGSHTFSAEVTDNVAVKAVTFEIVYPGGTQTQSFAASSSNGTTWTLNLSGFTDGAWSWRVLATDTAKRGGNRNVPETTDFTVVTGDGGGGGGGGGDVVTNAAWDGGGPVKTAAGRIYFEMPTNPKKTRWVGYVCSGTTIVDDITGRSIVLTAAHCVYDDANKAFARKVIFIPDQDATTGAGTDRDCSNDLHGCWTASYGVVDTDWSTRVFPANVAWDYAYYVVQDTGAHAGNGGDADVDLDSLADGTLAIGTSALAAKDETHALGYSYSEDPSFMFCAEPVELLDAANWWLPSCDLSGGSSGGPWLAPVGAGDGPIVSVNSWGYTSSPGMAGPKLVGTSAPCLLAQARATNADLAANVSATC